MGQDGTAHENGDLLHNLDARVTRLPRLLALTHSLARTENMGSICERTQMYWLDRKTECLLLVTVK